MFSRQVASTYAWSLIFVAVAFCGYFSFALAYFYDNQDSLKSITSLGSEAVLSQKHTADVSAATNTTNTKKQSTSMKLETNFGVITLELFPTKAPKTVENFTKLAAAGFYDGIRFHRVIKGFMIQAGDPNSKDLAKQSVWGQGGPGYQFADEMNPRDDLYAHGYPRGTVAMANAGPNTNGSQFFIMHKDTPLPANYTIFGKVTAGLDVVDTIANVATYMPGQVDRPLSDVLIKSVKAE